MELDKPYEELPAGWMAEKLRSCLLTGLQGRMEGDSEDLLSGWKARDCGGGL